MVLHNYAIQFLLFSKFRHAMQSRHQTEMAKGQVFLYLIISSIYITIIYSQVLLTVATRIGKSSDSVYGLDCDRVTTFSKV